MKRQIFILISLIIFISSLFSEIPDRQVTAVLDLQGTGLSRAESNAITNLLISSIFETDLLSVIDRNQRELILSEIAFSLSGCADDSCAVEVGKMLAADIIVTGSIDQIGSRLSIDLKALEVTTSKIVGTYNKMFDSVDNIVDSIESIGGQFVQNFTGQMASRKAILDYEKLVPLVVTCDVEDARVFIDGDAVGKITDGSLTKAVNIDAEIIIRIEAVDYYPEETRVLMDKEQRLNIELDLYHDKKAAFKANFGGGTMGSLVFSIFTRPNWNFFDIGIGFTVSETTPVLVNIPISLKYGGYLVYDDRSRIRPYVGGVVLYDFASYYDTTFFIKDPAFFLYGFDFGGYGGVEFKITDNFRLSGDVSLYLSEVYKGFLNIIQLGIGVTLM